MAVQTGKALGTHPSADAAIPSVVRERPAPPAPLGVALWRRFGRALVTIVNVGAFLLLWEWAVASGGIPALFVPRVSDIGRAIGTMANNGQLALHVSYSATNFVWGFGLACIVGIPLGLLMGASRWVDAIFGPYVWALYATPRIALQPLFILWLGFTVESKVLLIFLSAVMPIIITSMDGVKTVDASLLKAARVFGASKLQLYTRVILPFTVPFIMTGLRQGVGRGLIGLLVSEMFGSARGVGYIIARAGQNMDAPEMFAMLVLLVAFSVVLVYVMAVLEKRVAPWRDEIRV